MCIRDSNNAIAIAVSLDDYGNLPKPEYYPKVGDTITATYADDVKYIDSRTGELCTEDTPEEYLQEKLYGARDVAYTVCALVELPSSMSYRYGGIGYETVLSVDTAQRDSGGAAMPMLYLFCLLYTSAWSADAPSRIARSVPPARCGAAGT